MRGPERHGPLLTYAHVCPERRKALRMPLSKPRPHSGGMVVSRKPVLRSYSNPSNNRPKRKKAPKKFSGKQKRVSITYQNL